MHFRNRLFQIRMRLIDFKLKSKRALPLIWSKLKSVNRQSIADAVRRAVYGIDPLIRQTSDNLADWKGDTATGRVRIFLFFSLLGLIFFTAGQSYRFLANDAFISFRYVSNAVKGWGYVFNPPPFEPVSGFTSFLWLAVLRLFWGIGLQPPVSANLLTFLFSMGQVYICFLFVRRMDIQLKMRQKSLWLFFAVCLILLTNRTFLAFISSGTEAALFNFLALWWTYEATNAKNRSPITFAVIAVLLALCRTEGFVFIPATVLFLFFVFAAECSLKRIVTALAVLGLSAFYYGWMEQTYGAKIPNSVSFLYVAPFPPFGRDYILSFIIEYALYYWLFFLALWALFKFGIMRQKGFASLFLLLVTFIAYLGYFLFFTGGDVLEYRPLSFFIPLLAVGGVKMIAENVCGKPGTLLFFVFIYLLISTPIPWTHRALTEDLTTRKETAFLYRPVADKAGVRAFFAKQWDEAQKRLIYQGVGLRHQEHKVLTEELLLSFPDRKDGEKFKKSDYRLFAWNIVGVAGWTLPETFIIDLSGQNNKLVAKAPLMYQNRRLFGHERNMPAGYVQCFNGGNNLAVNPFAGKKNLRALPSAPLTDGKIKGCEDFWESQSRLGKAKPLRAKLR